MCVHFVKKIIREDIVKTITRRKFLTRLVDEVHQKFTKFVQEVLIWQKTRISNGKNLGEMNI